MDFTIKQKLIGIAFIFCVVLLVETFLSTQHISLTKEHADTLREKTLPNVATIRSLEKNVIQVQQWLTDISATRGQDGLDDGFKMAEHQAKEFSQNLSRLEQLNPEMNGSILALKNSFRKYYEVGQNMAKAYVKGGPELGNKTMGSFDESAEKLHTTLDLMATEIELSLKKSLEEQQLDSDRTASQSMLAVAILLAFLLIVAVSIHFLLLKPLAKFKDVLSSLNDGKANLSYRFNKQGSDEISAMTNELDTFFNALQEITKRLDQQAIELSEEVSSTVAIANKSHKSVIGQQDEIQMVTAAIEEMSATSDEVAEKAETTANETSKAKDLATQGTEVVMSSIEAINSVSTKISETSDIMNQLAMDTAKIESMLDVIKSIAEQTNLLALNAAIEAARAGEQGRGFAVVADEVRTLAAKTQESTSEITQIIASLQNVSSNAVHQMEESCIAVESCVEKSAKSGELITEISHTADLISDMTTQIATAMEQQTAVSAEIAQSVVKVHDVSIENATSSDLTISSMTNLDKNSKVLLEIANQFSNDR